MTTGTSIFNGHFILQVWSNLCMEDNLSLMLGPLYLKAALDTMYSIE